MYSIFTPTKYEVQISVRESTLVDDWSTIRRDYDLIKCNKNLTVSSSFFFNFESRSLLIILLFFLSISLKNIRNPFVFIFCQGILSLSSSGSCHKKRGGEKKK